MKKRKKRAKTQKQIVEKGKKNIAGKTEKKNH